MKDQLLYQRIARLVQQNKNCIAHNNDEWEQRSRAEIEQIAKDCLPSGSGVDYGTKIDIDASSEDKLVLLFSFHHMNDGGMYDGWTEHSAIVTPSLAHDFKIKITGRDRNNIKEYLSDLFYSALTQTVNELAPA